MAKVSSNDRCKEIVSYTLVSYPLLWNLEHLLFFFATSAGALGPCWVFLTMDVSAPGMVDLVVDVAQEAPGM
jgi:hypothetical protein